MIQHLKKKFPDVCKQVFEFEYVFSRREIENTVVDSAIGRVGVIVSDRPFFCSCTLCIRVDFGDTSDVYDCSYFM